MKKLNRGLAFAVAAAMGMGMLAGCSKSADTKTNESGTDVKATDTAEPATKTDGEVPTLKIITIGGAPKDLAEVTEKINEYIEPKIGAKVEYEYLDWGEYLEKSARMINTGEPYDLAFGSSIGGIQELVQSGNVFADLNELLEKDAPKLKESIPEALWKGVTYEGKIYGVPAVKDTAAAQFWIAPSDFLKDTGMQLKEGMKVEDLGPILEAAKKWCDEKHPDWLPMSLAKDGVNSFFAMFEGFGKDCGVDVKYGTEEAVNIYKDPDVIAGFKALRDYQDKGYINKDANVADNESAPKTVISSGQGWPSAKIAWGQGRGYDVDVALRYGPTLSTGTIQGSFMVMNKVTKHPVEAIKYLELVNTDKTLRNMLAYGIEGKHWKLKDGTKNTYIKLGEKNENGSISNDYEVPAYSQGAFTLLMVPEGAPETQWEEVNEQNKNATESKLLGFLFDETPVQDEIKACSEASKEYRANLMTGISPSGQSVDEMLDELNKVLEQNGIQKIIDEYNKQIKAWEADNK